MTIYTTSWHDDDEGHWHSIITAPTAPQKENLTASKKWQSKKILLM